MLKNLSEGLKILEPHFEDNATVEGSIQTAFGYETRIVITEESQEKLKELGWTYSKEKECWVFPAYGDVAPKE